MKYITKGLDFICRHFFIILSISVVCVLIYNGLMSNIDIITTKTYKATSVDSQLLKQSWQYYELQHEIAREQRLKEILRVIDSTNQLKYK